MKHLGSHWTDFYEIRYEDFSKNCPKIQVEFKFDMNKGYLT